MRQDDVDSDAKIMFEKNFHLEFVLHAHDTSAQALKNSLTEFARDIEIADLSFDAADLGKDFSISMKAEEPTIIFDICAQFGRIRSVKIGEV